jgi:anti-sigma factor RsiW
VELPSTNCARAREFLSAQLDGELSEPELDRLETHLLVCPDCVAWAEQVRLVTAQLREATLEEPVEALFALPQRRRTSAMAPVALVAAVAAGLVLVLGSVRSHTLGSSQLDRSSPQFFSQVSAPVVRGLEQQRLGLDALPARLSSVVPEGPFRPV